MFSYLVKSIYTNRFILKSLVQRDLMMKYRRSKLGVLWSVMTPLGLGLIIGMVYGVLFGASPKEMISMILARLSPWIFMSGTADGATMCFPGAEGYIKQTSVDTIIYPLRYALVNFVTLLYSLLAFLILYLFMEPDRFSPIMILTVPGLIIIFFFAWGLANITSVINLYVRDFAPLQSLLFQGLFYATPIIYDPKQLDEKGFSLLYEINPFYYMIEIVKRPILGKVVPSFKVYVISIIICSVIFTIGLKIQYKYKKKIVFKL